MPLPARLLVGPVLLLATAALWSIYWLLGLAALLFTIGLLLTPPEEKRRPRSEYPVHILTGDPQSVTNPEEWSRCLLCGKHVRAWHEAAWTDPAGSIDVPDRDLCRPESENLDVLRVMGS